MHLETAKDEYFKNTNDLAQNNNSQKSGNSKATVFKNLIEDFDEPHLLYSAFIILRPLHLFGPYVEHTLLSSPHISPEQPPDLAVA